MPEQQPIPPHIWRRIREFLEAVPENWPGGAEIVLKVSKQGIVTACTCQGRIE